MLQDFTVNIGFDLLPNSQVCLFSGTNELPTIETIDTYMARLHSVILEHPQKNDKLITQVRDIVGRLNIDR